MSIRIQGLVRTFRQVREDLQRGIPDERRAAFRSRVRDVVQRVEEICARAGTTPDRLPTPSRNAYRFLKDLDLDALPPPSTGRAGPKPVRLSGIVRQGERMSVQLWAKHEELRAGGGERTRILDELRLSVTSIEKLCKDAESSPRGLAPPSRRIYAWMKWLADERNLARHVTALCRAAEATPPSEKGLRVHLANTSKLWQVRRHGRVVTLQLCEGFVAAPAALWRDIGQLSAGRVPKEVRGRLRDFAAHEDYAAILAEMDWHVAPDATEAGVHHDLDASFTRVNEEYFAGASDKPRLVWNDVPTVRKFGHYLPSRDTVMIALVLDDAAVPDFVVEFVLYHELLHKKLGAVLRRGRREVHTPEFRRQERRFARFAEAEQFLEALAERLR